MLSLSARRHTVEGHKEPNLAVGDPFPDTVAGALLCACEQGGVVGDAVEDLLGRWFDGTRGCDSRLSRARALWSAAHRE